MTREQATNFIAWAEGMVRATEAAAEQKVPDEVLKPLQEACAIVAPAVEVIHLLFFGEPGEGLAVKKGERDVEEVFVTKIARPVSH